MPGLWSSESRAYLRVEESSGTQEGGDIYHVIAGRMRRSYFLYKVNLHVQPSSCEKLINDDDEKSNPRGPGKGTNVLRNASSSAIRRSARWCVSPSELPRELGHPGFGAGTFGEVCSCSSGLFVPKTPFL